MTIQSDTAESPLRCTTEERLTRWRMILGSREADGIGIGLSRDWQAMDNALSVLYDANGSASEPGGKHGGSGQSQPWVARWLGDIRKYFPRNVVRVIQHDAMEKLNLKQLLMEPESLELLQPDINLVTTILSMKNVIPARTKDTARLVVRKLVDDLMKRLENRTRSAITGSLNRAQRRLRPRHHDIDWNRTIRRNLKHYQAEYQTIIPEQLVGYGRKQSSFTREIILCVDQSGSMASSIVYSSIFGAVMASVRAVKTHFVAFDTSIADLTENLEDPVDLLFGTQLGGGTDINGAVTYCQGLIRQPANSILVLISDLYEGGVAGELLRRVHSLIAGGVQVVVLLALSDQGHPSYDADLAAQLAALGAPAFACTPDQFPDLMAAAIEKRDIKQWAADQGLATARHAAGQI